MKIIDLLVKIANGEEVPKKIKYNNEIREYSYADRDYISDDSDEYYLFFNIMRKGKGVDFANALNDEVEIIKDTSKEDKKIEYFDDHKIDVRNIDELIDSINLYIELSTNKLNEIIDKINGE